MKTVKNVLFHESHLTVADFRKAAFLSFAAGSLVFGAMNRDDLWFLRQEFSDELKVTLNADSGSGVPAMKDHATNPRDMGVRTYGGKLSNGPMDVTFSVLRRSDGEALVVLTNMRSNIPKQQEAFEKQEAEQIERNHPRLFRAMTPVASARNLVVRQNVDGSLVDYPASQGFDAGWSFQKETTIVGHLLNLIDRDAKKRDAVPPASDKIQTFAGGNRPQLPDIAEGIVDLGLKGVGPVRMRLTPSSPATKVGLEASYDLTLLAFDGRGEALYGENTLFLTQNGEWALKDDVALEGPIDNDPSLWGKAKRWIFRTPKNKIVTWDQTTAQKTIAFSKELLKKLLTLSPASKTTLVNEKIMRSLREPEESKPLPPSPRNRDRVLQSPEPGASK